MTAKSQASGIVLCIAPHSRRSRLHIGAVVRLGRVDRAFVFFFWVRLASWASWKTWATACVCGSSRPSTCRLLRGRRSGREFGRTRSTAYLLCEEVGLVKRVHTLFGRNAQVVYELPVREEVEGVRQEVREVKGEIKVEGESLTS